MSDLEREEEIKSNIRDKFTEEQMCAYFLTKTIRSQYQFDDEFVMDWYEKIFEKKSDNVENVRKKLVEAYTRMLMIENKYENHLDYWIKQHKEKLVSDMELFFGGDPGK